MLGAVVDEEEVTSDMEEWIMVDMFFFFLLTSL